MYVTPRCCVQCCSSVYLPPCPPHGLLCFPFSTLLFDRQNLILLHLTLFHPILSSTLQGQGQGRGTSMSLSMTACGIWISTICLRSTAHTNTTTCPTTTTPPPLRPHHHQVEYQFFYPNMTAENNDFLSIFVKCASRETSRVLFYFEFDKTQSLLHSRYHYLAPLRPLRELLASLLLVIV